MSEEEYVPTPGGYRPKSKVHLIEPGHVLDCAGNHFRKLDSAGKVVTDFGIMEPKSPGTPTTVVPPAASRGETKAGLATGWITSAVWTNTTGKPVSSLRTSWVVPPAPSTISGQIVFLFNGIQDKDNRILQPVLQWGDAYHHGGNYWGISSWYAPNLPSGDVWHGPVIPVSVGTTLTGVITLTSQSASGFNYNCYFEGIANSLISVTNRPELTYCVQVLEAYAISKASDYPPIHLTAMKAIELKTGSVEAPLNWKALRQVTDTGQHCIVVSNASPGGEVDLYYNWIVWTTGDIGQGSAAVPGGWQIGDVNGDGHAEVIQLWNNNNRLAMIVYGWTGAAMTTLWSTGDMGQGPGALAWQIGDVNGDGRPEIVQLFNNNNRLGMIVYGWSGGAMKTLWSTGDVGQGSGAVAWQIGDINGDGRAEVIQLWNNNNRLAMVVYGWSGGAMKMLWGTSDIGQGAGAIPGGWQIGDVNGDGRAEVIQLWNNNNHLAMVVYGWSGGAMKMLWGTSDIGQGPGAVDGGWQIGDVNGDGRPEIVQLWNNNNHLAMIVYGWSGGAMKPIWSTGDIGQGPGAIANGWHIGDVNGDGRAEIIQLWNNNNQLAMLIYGWSDTAMTTIHNVVDVGEGPGAIAWLMGRVQGGRMDEIVQLWDNGKRLGAILYNPA